MYQLSWIEGGRVGWGGVVTMRWGWGWEWHVVWWCVYLWRWRLCVCVSVPPASFSLSENPCTWNRSLSPPPPLSLSLSLSLACNSYYMTTILLNSTYHCAKKNTIYQETTMLATSISRSYNHLLTIDTDDPSLAGTLAILKVSDHQYQWLAGGYDPGNRTF